MSKELAASGQLSAEQVEAWRRHWLRMYRSDVKEDAENIKQINALCDMALSSLRGTFAVSNPNGYEATVYQIGRADGIEAATKAVYAIRNRRFDDVVYQEAWWDACDIAEGKIRVLAQGQRESNSNPAPVHGQSKTGLTGSHPGAPTHQRSEAERIAGSRSNSGIQSSDHPSCTDRQEPADHRVCHAPGERCLRCDHYHGKAPVCKYAAEAEPGLSAEQIEHCRRYGVTTAMRYALCEAALRSLTARDEGIEAAAKWVDQHKGNLVRYDVPASIRALKGASHD